MSLKIFLSNLILSISLGRRVEVKRGNERERERERESK